MYERGEGGIVESVLITGSDCTYLVKQEYNVRYVLCSKDVTVTRQDGTQIQGNSLLPSGFFYILTTNLNQNGISYNLYGGGYGHGVGMSQNGADQMARAGFTAEDILAFYFPETRLVRYEKNGSLPRLQHPRACREYISPCFQCFLPPKAHRLSQPFWKNLPLKRF